MLPWGVLPGLHHNYGFHITLVGPIEGKTSELARVQTGLGKIIKQTLNPWEEQPGCLASRGTNILLFQV